MLQVTSIAENVFPFPVEKTEVSFLQVPMEWIWGALLVTIVSMFITGYFLIHTIQKMRGQGSNAKLRTIVPNIIMMVGLLMMGIQWILNYVVLIVTDRTFCFGCYFQEFYIYSMGLSVFLIGWLMHVQHYLIKPQGVLRHGFLNWYLNFSIMMLVTIVVTYFLVPFLRVYMISLSSLITTLVIFSFNIIILVVARKDLRRTPRSIAVRRLRLKALIIQALVFLLMFLAGLVYAVLLNMKSYNLLDWYGVMILPIISNRGLLFVIVFNLLIYWTVYPHDAFIIQEGFHATEIPFFIDDPRKVITCSNGVTILCSRPQSSPSVISSVEHEKVQGVVSDSQRRRNYLWVADVFTPWDIKWKVLNERSTASPSQSTTVYFLPLSLMSSSSFHFDSFTCQPRDQEEKFTSIADYSTSLSPSHWWEELQDALLTALQHLHGQLKGNDSIVLVFEGILAVPSLLILEKTRERQPELMERVESLYLVSPMTPTVQRAFTRKMVGWGRSYLPRGFIYLSLARWFTTQPVISSKILSYLEKIEKNKLLQFIQELNDFIQQVFPRKKHVNPFNEFPSPISVILAQSCPLLSEHQRDMLSLFASQTVIFLQGQHGFLESYSQLVDQVVPSIRVEAFSRSLTFS